MNAGSARGTWIVVVSMLVALALAKLPMPDSAELWRPSWVALVLIYWCIALPERAGVLVGWLVGLIVDVMSGTLLGQHALAFGAMAFVAHKLHLQMRVLPLWQQAVMVFGLVFLSQLLILWINGIKGTSFALTAYLTVPFVSMLLWPWVFVVLRDIRRRFHVI